MKTNKNLVTVVDVPPRSFSGMKVTPLTPGNAVKRKTKQNKNRNNNNKKPCLAQGHISF